ncbi:MAG: SRPBCC family protein [Flavobacteriaceae bacterium]|jgi:hypothetical protein|nr:SRPBCC family protein [Flavobacteriaceae bacterium]
MNITGDKVVVNKPASELYEKASNPAGYKDFLPPNISKFEADDNGFSFAIEGMPEIELKIKEKTLDSKVVFTSAKDSIQFDLSLLIDKVSETSSQAQIIFDGQFNPFISMMIEKPLKNFVKTLTQGIAQL